MAWHLLWEVEHSCIQDWIWGRDPEGVMFVVFGRVVAGVIVSVNRSTRSLDG